MSTDTSCAFCDRIVLGGLTAAAEHAVAFADAFPVSPGHTLIVPRRHEADYFALSEAEQAALRGLVQTVRQHIESRYQPDGYNLGINIGRDAGQTIAHAYLHVIPRYAGDLPDPRGGVRWVLPARAPYWTE